MEVENKSCEVKVKLTLSDYKAFTKHTVGRNKTIMVILIVASLFIMGIFVKHLITDTPDSAVEVLTFLFPLLLLVIIVPWSISSTQKREFFSNKALQEEMKYTLQDQTLILEGETFNSSFTWKKLHKITENKNYFFFWQSKNSANILPKRDLSVEAINLITSKMANTL